MASQKDDLVGHSLEGEMRATIERGIMAGYGPGVFAPNDPVTRAQFATFLARALDLPAGESNFTDVSESYILRDGISRAASAGLVSGYPDNIFKPEERITREQMAALIDRSLDYKGIEKTPMNLSFTDTDKIAQMFRTPVANNTYFGIIGGFPAENGQFRFGPKEPATRAQAAAFINRFLKVVESQGERQVHYQIATLDGKGGFTLQPTAYMNYADARGKISNPSNQVVMLGTEVVWMNEGMVYSAPPEGQKIVEIYEDEAMKKQLTYVTSEVEMKFLEANGNYVKVQIANRTGYVKPNGAKLVPSSLVKGRSYYVNEGGHLIHYIYNYKTDQYAKYTYGKAPSFIATGARYYSWDGINYTNASGQSVGLAHQYFNYLPVRTKTSYTAEELDSYIVHMVSTNDRIKESPLVGLGEVFKQAEEMYNVNALYLFAKAIHESDYGISLIAQEKKNLFGYQATDTDPMGNAKPFETFADSILFVAEAMNRRYIDPAGANYRGAVLGNKGHGMNMRYASDAYWGQKISGHMYRADNFLGKKDSTSNAYMVAQTKSELNVRPEPNTLQAAQFTYPGAGYYLVLLENSQQSDGMWHRTYSDSKSHEFGFVHSQYVNPITPVK